MKVPKKTLLFVTALSLFFLNFSKAQDATHSKTKPNSFVVHGKFSDEKLNFFTASIIAADFEQFRRKNETVMLQFKNGFELELISAKDLMVKNKMQDIDLNRYTDSPVAAGYKYPLFEIHDNGLISAEIQNTSK